MVGQTVQFSTLGQKIFPVLKTVPPIAGFRAKAMVLDGNGKVIGQLHFKFRQGSLPGAYIHITKYHLNRPGWLRRHDPDTPLLESFQIIMQGPGRIGLGVYLKPLLQMLPDRLTHGPAPHQTAGDKNIFSRGCQFFQTPGNDREWAKARLTLRRSLSYPAGPIKGYPGYRHRYQPPAAAYQSPEPRDSLS